MARLLAVLSFEVPNHEMTTAIQSNKTSPPCS